MSEGEELAQDGEQYDSTTYMSPNGNLSNSQVDSDTDDDELKNMRNALGPPPTGSEMLDNDNETHGSAPSRSGKYWQRMYEYPKPMTHKQWLKRIAERNRAARRKNLEVAKFILNTTLERSRQSQVAYEEWYAKKAKKAEQEAQMLQKKHAKNLLRLRILSALSTREERHREWERRKAAEMRRRKYETASIKAAMAKHIEAQEKENQLLRDAKFQNWVCKASSRLREAQKGSKAVTMKAKEALKEIEAKKSRRKEQALKMEEDMLRRFEQFQNEGWVQATDPKTGRNFYKKAEEEKLTDPAVEAALEKAREEKQKKRQIKSRKMYKEWKKVKNTQIAKQKEDEKKAQVLAAQRKEKAKWDAWKRRKCVLSYSKAKDLGIYERTPRPSAQAPTLLTAPPEAKKAATKA